MSSTNLYNSYARANLQFVRGEGSRLYTSDGEEYLDFIAGIAVMSLGHCHPALVEAIKTQAEQLWHVSNLFEIPGQEKLGRLLCENTFADSVFFTNSGTEAMECAFKTARRYHYANGAPERIDIITVEGAFHGRSLAGIAATGNQKYLEGFGPKTGGFLQIPFGDADAVRNAVESKTAAAVVVEPIQGEGGIRPFEHEELRQIRSLCDANGVLLIYDEIQCGVGRTGKLFAHEWAETEEGNASPDIMAVAKGIGGGFPLGACLARHKVAEAMSPGSHGSTYGGNPLAMAVGTAVLTEILRDKFLGDINNKSIVFKQSLAELVDAHPKKLESFRGEGLMQGLQCKATNTDVVAAFRDNHLLSAPAGDNVVRLVPPLTISEDDLRLGVERMDAALSGMNGDS